MEEFEFESYESSDVVLRLEIFPKDGLDFQSDSDLNLFETGNSSDATSSVKIKTLSISSPVLASNSPFFCKLFKNDMNESQEKNFTLRINESEESGLMDVLNFMYCCKLRATTIPDLLQVLIVANKFEVTCCMMYCCDLLLKIPMSIESAIKFMNLPPKVLMDQSTQPLKDAVINYTSGMFNLQEKAMCLSLSDVEILLACDDLRVKSEDDVLYFIDHWSSAHYPSLLEYQIILNSLCFRFLRFHYLSFDALNQIQESYYFDKIQLTQRVNESLMFKAGAPCSEHQQQQQQRIYELRPLKGMLFHYLSPHGIVFLELNKDECARLFPDKQIVSESFSLDRLHFCLKIKCGKDEQGLIKLCVFLSMWPKQIQHNYDIDFELAVLMNNPPHGEYKLLFSTWRTGFAKKGWEILWTELMAEDSRYFKNEIVRFRAEIVLKSKAPNHALG